MKYLNEYYMNDNDIEYIYNHINDSDWIEITCKENKIKELFDYLKNKGFCKFRDLILYKRKLIHMDKTYVEQKMEKCNITNIVEKLNEDVNNFDLIIE